ncbi:MAG: hypothetical protein ACRBF0_00445 [Calditrichia bacterium]
MKFLPWSEDHWLSREGKLLPWDKLEHFAIAFLGVFLGILLLGVNVQLVLILAGVAGVAWEIKDGFVAYNDAGDIQGFSWKDIVADFAGIGLAYALTLLQVG